MERTLKDFNRLVREIRKTMPTYNNGRKVIVLSGYTKKGETVLGMARKYEGDTIYDVYKKPSYDKIQAYESAWCAYYSDPTSYAWSLCSHNCQMFSCSWVTTWYGCVGIVFLTNKTEYLVLINE